MLMRHRRNTSTPNKTAKSAEPSSNWQNSSCWSILRLPRHSVLNCLSITNRSPTSWLS